jgi:hypothetical protein
MKIFSENENDGVCFLVKKEEPDEQTLKLIYFYIPYE